jgi:hypothetical protein
MRNEMIGAVVRRAIEHPEFRDALLQDPGQALQNHGFVLEADDFAEIERLRQSIGQREDAETALRSIADDYGIEIDRANG